MAGAAHLACIIGWPVAHSLSPAIHTAAFDALNLDWTYIAVPVRPGNAGEGIGLLRTLGVDGANVTMPHKQAVIEFLDGVEGDAAVVGAVNTIVRAGERLIGHNTDGEGFLRFLRLDAGVDPAGADVLVLGAGGAARAVSAALVRAGARVTVAARRPELAKEVADLAGARESGWDEAGPSDILVNATPAREGLPLDRFDLSPARVVVDLIYAPPQTELVGAARDAGARAFDGLGMLLHQAVLSFHLWTGLEPPLESMRAAAMRALEPDGSGQTASD